MRYRQLGKTGFEVSEIGFGTWAMGGTWGPLDDENALRALNHAVELGVNFFDTALAYGDGHSESLIGQALGHIRHRLYIATKIPPKTYRWPVKPHQPVFETFPADWIVRCTEKSLRNLKTDYIDLQQLHAWTPAYVDQLDWYEALTQLKKEGKIRAFGISANDWDPYGPVEVVQAQMVDSVQVIYNIFEQRAAEKLLPAAAQHQVGIIVRVPFQEGLLTGRIGPGIPFAEGDWRANWLSPERLQEAGRRVERLKTFLNERRPTLASLALKFCLSHPAVSTVIPGMRRQEHVEANVAASDGDLLSDEELRALKEHAFSGGWDYPWAD